MITPFILMGFSFLIYKSYIIYNYKIKTLLISFYTLLFFIILVKLYLYIPLHEEKSYQLIHIANFINENSNNNDLVISMTKFSPYLTSKTSDLILPLAYDYDNAM